ncbi:hypothetical protein [Faecalibacterium langellae]|uniref:hypothetical protein n=1 Tax=Faecalibacterium langellae TaxID=3435293 RepID=UPI00117AAFCC|nr:hypothetical protein [Faecalibacterium prausnitzii]
MELTIDLSSIVSRDIRVLSPNNYLELYNDPSREPWELFFKPHQLEKVFQSSFSVTSSQLREFLTETFGIPFELDNNSNRNRLNEMIKDIAPTQRGKRTKLNFYQYRNLILSDKFNKFILSKHDEWKVDDQEKMYNEIMYLQVNKFKESALYQEQKKKDTIYYANALSLVEGFDQVLKQYYSMFLDLWHIQRVDYRYIEAPAETKQMLDIVSYRFRQKSPLVYKFDSRDDVYSTTKNQIIEWFLQDVDRWANNEIK